MVKLYRDRDWLWEHYIARKESTYAIAREAKCSQTTIRNWLHKIGIPIRANDGLWQDRKWLYEYYIVREKSSSVMAEEVGCNPLTIRNWLHRHGIPVRNIGDASFLVNKNSVTITSDLLEFLEGEILGDGCVYMPGNRSAYYRHSSALKEYLIWLSECLDEWKIEQVGQINSYKDKGTGAIGYFYNSRSYPELVPIYKRWYAERNGKMKKIVPKDFGLTSIKGRQWYLGDGGFDSYKTKCPGIKLCTCDFNQQSIEYLIEELNKLGFAATHQPAANIIHIPARRVPDFLKWIGPCPISCYDYKWEI